MILHGCWNGNIAEGGDLFTDGHCVFTRAGLLPDAIGMVAAPWQEHEYADSEDDEKVPTRKPVPPDAVAALWARMRAAVQVPVRFGRTFAMGRPWLEVVRCDEGGEAWLNPELLVFVRGATGCDGYAQACGVLDAIVCYRQGEPVAAMMPLRLMPYDGDPRTDGKLLSVTPAAPEGA